MIETNQGETKSFGYTANKPFAEMVETVGGIALRDGESGTCILFCAHTLTMLMNIYCRCKQPVEYMNLAFKGGILVETYI